MKALKLIFIFCIAAIYFILFSNCRGTSAASNNNDKIIQSESLSEGISGTQTNNIRNAINPSKLFTLNDADKILGEPAHLSDSVTALKIDVLTFNSTFTANSLEQKTSKIGNIYFMYEQYTNDTSASRVYAFIKKSNENHGIKVLHDLGDEAYFHSDNENFYFILVRKGASMFRMKVNKITTNTSLEAFKLIAKNITETL